jgi:DsbC/DsbD-like thiol-disulfide interchange protein
MTGHIDAGWHIYSMSTAAAIPTTIQLAPNSVVERYRILQPQPKRAFDSSFGADTETYDREVAFLVELQLKKDAPAGPAEISVTARYQTCNDVKCIPPVRRTATAELKIDPAVQAASVAIPNGAEASGEWRHTGGPGMVGLPAGGIWIRAGYHLHALRVSDDPHHHVVFPQSRFG